MSAIMPHPGACCLLSSAHARMRPNMMRFARLRLCTALCAVLAVTVPGSAAAGAAPGYRIETVADGLDHPWSLAFLPDGRLLVTERPGRLRMVEDGTLSAPVTGVPAVHAVSQGGLFEVLPASDFADSGLLYLSYAAGGPDANATTVLRARLADGALVDGTVVFAATPTKDTPVHYGGRMCHRGDGTVLIGLGDGFDYREAAQDAASHLGSIVRLAPDGAAPSDNPFRNVDGALPETYSIGHRNIQGLVCDDEGVWAHEHGPRGGDELNRIGPGANYGWPVATGGIDYSGARVSPFERRPGMVAPVVEWTPSIGPSGMTRYRGGAFPDWNGDLFVSTLVERSVRRLIMDGDAVSGQEVLFTELDARIRDVATGPDGFLYLLTDADDGAILRVRPAP